MKEQFEWALAHYKNDGTPYELYADRCKGCGKSNDDLEEGTKLLKCGKCKEMSYCSKECQKGHWAKHKATCKKPEKRQEEEQARAGPGGIQWLNV